MMVDVNSAGTDVGDDNGFSIVDTSANLGLKPAERSVSFNRDVHVKRIGES